MGAACNAQIRLPAHRAAPSDRCVPVPAQLHWLIMAASTAIVAEEPLVLTKASIADGLSLIDRVLDEPSGMPSFAYTKLTLASRGATDLDIGSDALKFVRYVGVPGAVA